MNVSRYGTGHRRTAALAAVVGASAVVTLGALTVAMDHQQAGMGTVNVGGGGSMSLGNTATEVPAAQTSLATSIAVPPVKATQFGES